MITLAILAVLCLMWWLKRFLKPCRLPPSPRGYPLLGNALDIPMEYLFLKFAEWQRELGDIYTLNAAGQKMVVLCNAKLAADILDRLSAYTSGRPKFIMASDIMCGEMMFSTLGHGDRWRRMRRVVHEGFNVRAIEAYHAIQESEAANLVRDLMTNPASYHHSFQSAASAVMWRALYGTASFDRSPKSEARLRTMTDLVESILHAFMPMSYMVELIPVLRHLPTWLAKWKKFGIEFFHNSNSFLTELFEEGREQKGEASAGFAATTEEACKGFGVTTQEAAWTAGTLYFGGLETTTTAMENFLKAMLLYPEVAKKARAQIDEVTGDVAPTLADRDKLQYVKAIVNEVLRWRPPAPMGVPHVVTEEFAYGDYVFPKGTLIFANLWSINRDPKLYPDFETFRPERFLDDESGKLKPPLPDHHEVSLSYGHGRRICPARHFANNSLFIQIAYLLWAFEFRNGRDENGARVAPVPMDFVDSGMGVHPGPFKCEFIPRQPNLADILPYA